MAIDSPLQCFLDSKMAHIGIQNSVLYPAIMFNTLITIITRHVCYIMNESNQEKLKAKLEGVLLPLDLTQPQREALIPLMSLSKTLRWILQPEDSRIVNVSNLWQLPSAIVPLWRSFVADFVKQGNDPLRLRYCESPKGPLSATFLHLLHCPPKLRFNGKFGAIDTTIRSCAAVSATFPEERNNLFLDLYFMEVEHWDVIYQRRKKTWELYDKGALTDLVYETTVNIILQYLDSACCTETLFIPENSLAVDKIIMVYGVPAQVNWAKHFGDSSVVRSPNGKYIAQVFAVPHPSAALDFPTSQYPGKLRTVFQFLLQKMKMGELPQELMVSIEGWEEFLQRDKLTPYAEWRHSMLQGKAKPQSQPRLMSQVKQPRQTSLTFTVVTSASKMTLSSRAAMDREVESVDELVERPKRQQKAPQSLKQWSGDVENSREQSSTPKATSSTNTQAIKPAFGVVEEAFENPQPDKALKPTENARRLFSTSDSDSEGLTFFPQETIAKKRPGISIGCDTKRSSDAASSAPSNAESDRPQNQMDPASVKKKRRSFDAGFSTMLEEKETGQRGINKPPKKAANRTSKKQANLNERGESAGLARDSVPAAAVAAEKDSNSPQAMSAATRNENSATEEEHDDEIAEDESQEGKAAAKFTSKTKGSKTSEATKEKLERTKWGSVEWRKRISDSKMLHGMPEAAKNKIGKRKQDFWDEKHEKWFQAYLRNDEQKGHRRELVDGHAHFTAQQREEVKRFVTGANHGRVTEYRPLPQNDYERLLDYSQIYALAGEVPIWTPQNESISNNQLIWLHGFPDILPWYERAWTTEDEEAELEDLSWTMNESLYRPLERPDWDFLITHHQTTFTVDLAPEVLDVWALQHVRPDVWVFDLRTPQRHSWSESLNGSQNEIVGVERLVREVRSEERRKRVAKKHAVDLQAEGPDSPEDEPRNPLKKQRSRALRKPADSQDTPLAEEINRLREEVLRMAKDEEAREPMAKRAKMKGSSKDAEQMAQDVDENERTRAAKKAEATKASRRRRQEEKWQQQVARNVQRWAPESCD